MNDNLDNIEVLQPCPFSGGDAQIVHFGSEYIVECKFCEASTVSGGSREKSIKLWNTRSIKSGDAAKMLAALRSIVKTINETIPNTDDPMMLSGMAVHIREMAQKAIGESAGVCKPDSNNTVPPLQEGWKMYGKYLIQHADGTPLKGKKYFVLRLDSPVKEEAMRVNAAMAAYKGELNTNNAAALREAAEAFIKAVAEGKMGAVGNYPPSDLLECVDSIIKKTQDALADSPRMCDKITDRHQAIYKCKDYLKEHGVEDIYGGRYCDGIDAAINYLYLPENEVR